MIGEKVVVISHNELHDDYYNLIGIIINYKEEKEIKRARENNNNPTPTGKIITLYQIEFDNLPKREMSKKLWLYREMFKIL